MASPNRPATINLNNTGLIYGQRYKPYQNRGIYARLIVSEMLEGLGGGTGVLIAIYDKFGANAFIKAVKAGALLAAIPPEAIDETISELGGVDKVVDILRGVSSFGLAPDQNAYYIFEDDDLSIPAGEYTTNSIYQIGSKFYKIVGRSDWAGYADWIMGVPNLSWLGRWKETPQPNSIPNLTVVREADIINPGNNSTNEQEAEQDQQNKQDLSIVLGVGGFLIGGPVGSLIGFGLGTIL